MRKLVLIVGGSELAYFFATRLVSLLLAWSWVRANPSFLRALDP